MPQASGLRDLYWGCRGQGVFGYIPKALQSAIEGLALLAQDHATLHLLDGAVKHVGDVLVLHEHTKPPLVLQLLLDVAELAAATVLE